MMLSTIETLETDLKQYILDQWGVKQQRKYSIFFTDDWRIALHRMPLLRLKLAAIPRLKTKYAELWQRSRAYVIHSPFRSNICIKETYATNISDTSVTAGKLLFDMSSNIFSSEWVFCHEFTHVCSMHLKLPFWLNEGLAMLTVENYFQARTVNYSTLDLLKKSPQHVLIKELNQLNVNNPEIVASHYAAGYWLSRYLHEQHPESFKYLLAKPRKEKEIKTHLSKVCGLDVQNLNTIVLNYFHNETTL